MYKAYKKEISDNNCYGLYLEVSAKPHALIGQAFGEVIGSWGGTDQ